MNYKHKTKYKEKEEETLDELLSNSPDIIKKIECPYCSSSIPAHNLNINEKIAKCGECDSLFSIDKEIDELKSSNFVAEHEIIRPEGIDIFHYKEEIDISVNQPLNVGLQLITAFVFVIAFTYSLLLLVLSSKIVLSTILLMTTIIPWLFCFFFFYKLSNRSKHRINISINDRYMTVQWRPKNFTKDQYFDIEDIEQLYVSKDRGYYCLNMIINGLEGQKYIKLIQYMKSLPHAKYLEQEIEKNIGIIDKKPPNDAI